MLLPDGRAAKENMLKLAADKFKTNFDALCTKLQKKMQKYFDDHADFTGHRSVATLNLLMAGETW